MKFAPFGIPGTLIAPAYQHVFDIAGEDSRADIHKSQLNLFVLSLFNEKKNWILLDLQAVIDYENDIEFGQLEAEAGQMMFGGLSSYIRPGVGVGKHRPLDWNLELGFKAVWR